MTALSASRRRTRSLNRLLFAPAVLVLAASLLLSFSVWALRGEVTSYIEAGGTDAAFFERLSHSPPMQPISLSSTETVLMRCESIWRSALTDKYAEGDRIFVALHCLEFARRSVDAMPSYAYGWYSVALFSFTLAEQDAGSSALARSQIVGRSEQWLAERRVQLAEAHLDALDQQTKVGHERDLILLAQSTRGVRSIARRYVENADFRERITALVETLPEADQARFVTTVRSAARQLNVNALPS